MTSPPPTHTNVSAHCVCACGCAPTAAGKNRLRVRSACAASVKREVRKKVADPSRTLSPALPALFVYTPWNPGAGRQGLAVMKVCVSVVVVVSGFGGRGGAAAHSARQGQGQR